MRGLGTGTRLSPSFGSAFPQTVGCGSLLVMTIEVPSALALSALAMSLIVAARYAISSGAFALATHRVRPGLYTGLNNQIRREVGWSLASAAIYGIPAGIVAWGWQNRGWTLIYTDFADHPLWYLPASLFAYLLLHDTWFYWTHRLFHQPRWFRLAHAVHHESRPPTAWAAMSSTRSRQ